MKLTILSLVFSLIALGGTAFLGFERWQDDGGDSQERQLRLAGFDISEADLRKEVRSVLAGPDAVIVCAMIQNATPEWLLENWGDDGQLGEPQEVGCGITARVRKDLPNLPEGLVSLSTLYEMSVPPEAKEQGCLVTTISLTTPTQDAANLGFYTYEEGNWRWLGAATLAEDGGAAEAQLTDIPVNMAVLRLATRSELMTSTPTSAAVDATLPAGAVGVPDEVANPDDVLRAGEIILEECARVSQ